MKNIIFWLVILISAFTSLSMAQEFKIGVAASGSERSAAISEVAARAPYFLFFDGQGNFLEAINNPSTGTAGGAGQKTANLLSKKKVTLFVAGRVGGKLEMALKKYNVAIIEQRGVVHDVVKSIIQKQ